ncbi:MAG: AAA family ATPase [Acidimicrobiia bacterium]
MTPVSPRVVETHVSYVFLFGDRAVKLKKPARFEFVDLSTVDLRRIACRREVELNRRLAPDVYLGTFAVVDDSGEAIDHLVVMRRMPDERRLSALVRAGAVSTDEIHDLARVIAAFHERAGRSPEIDAVGRATALRARWEAGFHEVHPFVGGILDEAVESEIETLADRYLAGREALFDERIAHGAIRDGHGDLLADDVFLLDDGPRVLDCLEFDDALRYGDVLADVGFLAMDLERLGAPELASEFLAHYRELTAATWPRSLAHHFVAFRAHIRAKVACFRHVQGDPDAAVEARRLLELCLDHLRAARVRLVLVGGAPGTGKTTAARGVAERLGWALLRSDVVRKELAGLAPESHAPAPLDEGIYGEAVTERVYTTLLDESEMLLRHGEPVVLDATWASAATRTRARELAARTASELVEIRCVLDPGIVAQRVGARARSGHDASDATPELAAQLALRFEAWPEAAVVDTDAPGARVVGRVVAQIVGDVADREYEHE